MNKTKFMTKVSTTISKAGLSLKKHSPEILIVVGIGGVIASTIMACKATTKLDEIINESKEELEDVHNCPSNVDETIKRETTRIYVQTGLKIAQLYLPAITIGVFSLSGIIASNEIMRKRSIALASAYATIDHSFKEYRERVIERFGKEVDDQLRFNMIPVEIEKKVIDNDGNEIIVKETVNQLSETGLGSDYARLFDETNSEYKDDASYNRMRLEAIQSMLNDKLKAQGYLFLNDAYDALGFPRTKAGQVVGWKYDYDNENGDNYIDFGFHDVANPKVRDFLNGDECSVIIDFNVDGDILTGFDKIVDKY